MSLLTWIRGKFFGSQNFSDFELEHYARFEEAVKISDVEADVYNQFGYKGKVIVPKGEEHHTVTESNLVQFRKLTRRERRYISKVFPTIGNKPTDKEAIAVMEQQVRDKYENNLHIHRQADG